MKFCFTCLFILAGNLLLNAQTKETLTNKSIVDLTKAGFDSSLIVSKIETSDCKFDVSTNGLIALKKEKVSPYVISVMMNKISGKATVTQTVQPAGKCTMSKSEYPSSMLLMCPTVTMLIHASFRSWRKIPEP